MSAEAVETFERRFGNEFEALGRVTEEALGFLEALGAGAQAVYLANLAIEEVGTNILKYGYDDTRRHEILLRLAIQPVLIELVLEDDGHEFNPLTAPDPELNLPPEERIPGGLGIHLIRKLIPDIAYERARGLNRLTLRIPL